MRRNDIEAEARKKVEDWLRDYSSDRPAVVVPVFNALTDVLECVQSLVDTTPEDTPILVLDDASTDPRVPEALEPLARSLGFAYVLKSTNSGFVGTVNLAFDWSAPHDVVVLNSDVVVPPQWLERLAATAYSRPAIATATPLTNHGTILSIPYRNQPIPHLPEGMTIVQVDSLIREASAKLRPIIPAAVGHCTYYRRSALDTVGYFDEAFSPGYGEEVDFSQRAVMSGFVNVASDDLFVFHKGSRSFDPERQQRQQRLQMAHESIVKARYPWYHAWVRDAQSDAHSPLALAIESARAALLGYRIAIDASGIQRHTTGTQVLILELVRALTEDPDRKDHLSLIVGDRTPEEALLGVEQLVDEVIRCSDLRKVGEPIFDLVHRPSQLRSFQDLVLLQNAGRRFIVSHLDCISFANPSYFRSFEEWADYRAVSRLAFAFADGILFISNDAATDAARQGLRIPAERTCVSYVGVNHQRHIARARPPSSSERLRERPFILMLGTDFRHKNRAYALRLLRILISSYQWPGQIVFAGPKVSSGGSFSDETRELEHDPELRSRVLDLGAVDEQEKRWLLENAALVLYPSIHEGFGLIPFEAAAAGSPALTTRLGSLGEVLGDKILYLETLDPELGAKEVWSLLGNAELAQEQVEAINAKAQDYAWQGVAAVTRGFYQQILRMPPRSSGWTVLVASEGRYALGKPLTMGWRRRVTRAFRILRTQGMGALLQETKQFIRWLRM